MQELLEYERLIYSIINRYPKRYDRDDLYQAAMLGLVEASMHYDKSQNTKFSSFAYYYITGEVHQYIRRNHFMKVGKDVFSLKKKIIEKKEEMTQKLGRVPTNLEISLLLEIDENVVEDVLLSTEDACSFEEVNDFSGYEQDFTRPDILDLKVEIGKLSEEEKKLLVARYYQEMTQQEVSSLLGMSQVQVSRQESKILQKLKTRL